jgi:hypothetical protein
MLPDGNTLLDAILSHQILAARHAYHGTNMPLAPFTWAWEGVTMDLVTDLPESMAFW